MSNEREKEKETGMEKKKEMKKEKETGTETETKARGGENQISTKVYELSVYHTDSLRVGLSSLLTCPFGLRNAPLRSTTARACSWRYRFPE